MNFNKELHVIHPPTTIKKLPFTTTSAEEVIDLD